MTKVKFLALNVYLTGTPADVAGAVAVLAALLNTGAFPVLPGINDSQKGPEATFMWPGIGAFKFTVAENNPDPSDVLLDVKQVPNTSRRPGDDGSI